MTAARLSVAQKAWVAGIVEIRGKIRYTNDPHRKTNQLVLQVRSTQSAVIARLCELTGTAIGTQSARRIVISSRRPCTQHCDQPHSHISAEIGAAAVWAISGAGAAIVLHNIASLFVENVAEMNAIVTNILAALPHEGRGRHAVDQTILRLRKLGWDIPEAAMEHFVGAGVGRHKEEGA